MKQVTQLNQQMINLTKQITFYQSQGPQVTQTVSVDVIGQCNYQLNICRCIVYYVKTQRKVMSDFSRTIVGIPPCDPFFFVAKIFFLNFPKKCRIFFSMKLTVKNLTFFRKIRKIHFCIKNKKGSQGEES